MNDYNSRLFGEKNTLSDTADSAVDKLPKMMTIREIAATGILPEYAIRTLVREVKFLQFAAVLRFASILIR